MYHHVPARSCWLYMLRHNVGDAKMMSALAHDAVWPASSTHFVITASVDGHIKFWKKKQGEGIEFVKHFGAHLGMSLLDTPCQH